MLFSYRTPLVLLAFFVSTSPLEANHLSSESHPHHQHKQTNHTEIQLQQYQQKLVHAYEVYREKTARVWGEETRLPDSKTDVTYRNNFKQRSIIDYEQGKVKIELALKPDVASNQAQVRDSMATAVEQTILQGPDERSIIDIAEHPDPPEADDPPILAGLLSTDNGIPVTANNIASFKRAKTRALSTRSITGRDGTQRIIYSTQFDLVPDHIRRRAERFSEAVDRNAKLRRIPSALIYAIMETESFFNPTAKSPAPAFGLMQLVPATGARDAYKFLYAKDIVVKEHYLYNPSANIELGVAYLHILYYRYFKQIRDPRSRQWATIAAYNTGFHNVIESLAGEFDDANHSSRWIWRMRALNKINKMKPDKVYDYFRKHLPSEETRDYIRKVRESMVKYQTPA